MRIPCQSFQVLERENLVDYLTRDTPKLLANKVSRDKIEPKFTKLASNYCFHELASIVFGLNF